MGIPSLLMPFLERISPVYPLMKMALTSGLTFFIAM